MCVAYTSLLLSRGVLLTYLLNLSLHYDGDVDVMCNSSFAYFLLCCNSPTRACKIVAPFILLCCTWKHIFSSMTRGTLQLLNSSCWRDPTVIICTSTTHNQATAPVAKSSTSLGWSKGGKVITGGWQVTLCDHMSWSPGFPPAKSSPAAPLRLLFDNI